MDSFSPKKTKDLIYNKIHRIQNKKNDSVYTFLKSISSNKKIKNLKIKKLKLLCNRLCLLRA